MSWNCTISVSVVTWPPRCDTTAAAITAAPTGAWADASDTLEVLDRMLASYPDLPRTPVEIERVLRNPHAVDRDGRFLQDGTQICFGFGRFRGHSLETH
jgi:hypothetical protein